MRFSRDISQGCVYAGCYAAWAWLCMVLTASTLDQTEIQAVVLFFIGAAVAETLRARKDKGRDGEDYGA